MSDKGHVRFDAKEKWMIGVYFVATTTSTVLFVTTLVVIIQNQNVARNNTITGTDATGHSEQQISDLNQEISKLNTEIELIRSEAENRTDATGHSEQQISDLNQEISKLKTEIKLIRSETENRKNSTKSLEDQIVVMVKEIKDLRAEMDNLRPERLNSSLCSLGVANGGNVSNGKITASSEFSTYYPATSGRLNKLSSCWTAHANDNDAWIQVDFDAVKEIKGVMTQGSQNYDSWVTSYKISCSNATNKNILTNYDGTDVIYNGNSDRSTIVTHVFLSSKNCRYVRIYPEGHHNYKSLRMDWLTKCT